jgi:hypothetical protein
MTGYGRWQRRSSIETTSRKRLLRRPSIEEHRMKKLMIAAAFVAGFVGLASAVQAHRPNQGAVECPSSKDWAKCLWQEIDRNSGG